MPRNKPEDRRQFNDLQRRRYRAARIAGIDVYTAMRCRGNAETFSRELRAVGKDPRSYGYLAMRFGRFAAFLFVLLGLMVDGWGCAGSGGEGRCVFDGRYEFGLIAETPGCPSTSQTLPLHAEDECMAEIDTFTPDGLTHRQGILSCEPGDPVIECEGFAFDSDGCQFSLYLRRLAR